MKQILLIFLSLILVISFSRAQSIECPGDISTISLTGYTQGDIQWQFSNNETEWTGIPGAVSPELELLLSEPGFVRAKVKEGICEYLSDTTKIILASESECHLRDSLAEIANRTTIGAIRWDAGWVGDVSPISVYTQRQMSPEKFRFRTPFFATIHKPDSVTFKYTQAIMDQEIAYAKNAGINYWVYNWYPNGGSFDIPLDLHLSSIHKDDMKFAYIFYSTNWQYVKNEFTLTMNRMKLPNYMKIDGKPLVFLMHNTWTLADINQLKSEATKAGIPAIYLVIMDWTGPTAIQKCSDYGAQASSAYCNWGEGGISYSVMAAATESKWDTHKNLAFGFIPFVTTGWDPRPIIEYYHGLPAADSISISQWYPKPAEDHYVQTATSDQVAAHLKAGLDWVKNNPLYSKPKTVIMYAWNECSEGGFIIPVAETDSSAINYGAKRLDAIKMMLDDYWKK
jgi:hypothetical protein